MFNKSCNFQQFGWCYRLLKTEILEKFYVKGMGKNLLVTYKTEYQKYQNLSLRLISRLTYLDIFFPNPSISNSRRL